MVFRLASVICADIFRSVIGAVIAQLRLLHEIRGSRDITFDSWSYIISTQFVQNLSVVTVCIPYVRNVLVGLESGMLQTGAFHLHKLSATTTENTGCHPSATSKRHHKKATSEQSEDTENPQLSRAIKGVHRSDIGPFHANNTAVVEANTPTDEWESESQSSRAKIIKQTTEWRIDRQRGSTSPEA